MVHVLSQTFLLLLATSLPPMVDDSPELAICVNRKDNVSERK